MSTKVVVLVLTALVSISLASVSSNAASGASASNSEMTEAFLFYDSDPITIPNGNSRYPFIERANFNNQDITQWFQSYFMTHAVDGKLSGAIPFRATFGPDPNNKNIIVGGSYIYRKGYFPIVKANDFQPITFPIVGGPPFPIIKKVLYGVPGHDIDMTEWFRNYYVQNQVNGRLDNHQIMFHHIYGDPLPNVAKQFKITYTYANYASTFWLAPPILISEYATMNYPQYNMVGGMNPVLLEAKYGMGSQWASDVTPKFTKWVCQSPRNGRYHGSSPGWNNLFGDPAPNVYKQIGLTYMHQIVFDNDGIDYYVQGRTSAQFSEAGQMVFPPNNAEAYPLILTVHYGTDSHKIDVTSQFLKFYIDNAKNTGRIVGSFPWNSYFGDPVPNVVKTIYIQYGYPKKSVANTLEVPTMERNIQEEEDEEIEFDE